MTIPIKDGAVSELRMAALDHVGGVGTIEPTLKAGELVAFEEVSKLKVHQVVACVLNDFFCPSKHFVGWVSHLY